MPTPANPRTTFVSRGYRYEIFDIQVKHVNHDTLLLAWRQSLDSGRRTQVVMKPFPLTGRNTRRERALEEAKIATYLEHPNVAKVFGLASNDDEVYYVASENVPGVYLATLLDYSLLMGQRLSPALAAYVAEMVADALAYVHGRESGGQLLHIVHRAVGPMCIRLGFEGLVKVTNFGTAFSTLRDRLATPPGELRGDAAYTAPELWKAVMNSAGPRTDRIIAGLIDGRADVFSLGLVLLEMLLGEYPLDPTDVPGTLNRQRVTAAIKTERPTWINPQVLADRVLRFDVSEVDRRSEGMPEALREIVRRALSTDPEMRFDAVEMRDRLRDYLCALERPFGRAELSSEVKALCEGVRQIKGRWATPIERTAFLKGEDGGASL